MFFIIEQALSFPGSESRIFVFMFFTCTISLLMMQIISWQLCIIVSFIWSLCVFYFGTSFVRRFKFLKESISDEQTQLPEHHSIRKQKFSNKNNFFYQNIIQIFLMFVGFNLHYTLINTYDVKTNNLKNEMFEITVVILIHGAISLSLAFYISYLLCFVILVVIIVSNMMLFSFLCKCFPYTCFLSLGTWISKIKNG